MATFSDRIYLRSPKAVQNVLVSLKGLQLEWQRRRGRYGSFLQDIRQRNRFTADQFTAYQIQRLRSVLEVAVAVPLYRDSFHARGVTPASLTDLADLERFPLLPKEQVRARARDLVPVFHDVRGLLRLNTTGTTGSPMVVYASHRARQENYAHFDNFFEQAGMDPRARRAVFGGRILQPGTDWRPPFWRLSRFQHALLFSSYHMTNTTLPGYLAALQRFRPAILEGYPSSLAGLARFVLETGGMPPVQGVVTSSETLLDEQREVIEKAFSCRVFDQYGAAEMCVFVGQCRWGRYHVRPDYGVVELLKDGRPATVGEEGEIVCTGFINDAMPLIRYQIGDLGRWAEPGCECGLETPILERILGRRDDVVVTPEGTRVGRLSPVLKGFPVREGQYLQNADGSLTVLLVPGPGFSPDCFPRLEEELRKRVGPSIAIRFETVDAIPRGAGGKLRAVISQYRP